MYTCKFSCLLHGLVVIGDTALQPEEEEEDEEHGNSVKILITCITPVLRASNMFPTLVLV